MPQNGALAASQTHPTFFNDPGIQLRLTRQAPSLGASRSLSFDHRRLPDVFFAAMAMAFFWPSRMTRRLPRVTPV